MSKPDITLAMIVKNESAIIERCLESVRPYVSRIVICDTGSTDGTAQVCWRYLRENHIAGFVYEDVWVDFGTNRTQALIAARNESQYQGYTLMLDADETLEHGDDKGHSGTPRDNTSPLLTTLENLTHDTYQMTVHYGACTFKRNFLFKNSREWCFRDPVHEYAHVEGDFTSGLIENAYILSRHDGARGKTGDKFAKDATILEKIDASSRTPRQQFYLAQSYRDCGRTSDAINAYSWRFHMEEGYAQERFYSAYMLGKLLKHETYFLKAYSIDPTRAEPLLALGKHYMDKGNFAAGEMFLENAHYMGQPANALFIERDVYDWRATMEYAVCLYYIGDYDTAHHLNYNLLDWNVLPKYARAQVETNQRFVEAKLHE